MTGTIEHLKTQDNELVEMTEKEFNRQRQNIELIASENIVSDAVLVAVGSILINKYA